MRNIAALLPRAVLLDEALASAALLLMLLIPLLEIALRPLFGAGIDNAALLVQHLGLLLAMAGAILAERGGHLTSLGSGLAASRSARLAAAAKAFALAVSALLCGLLTQASWNFVASEMAAGRLLAYALPVWVVQASMPLGFAILGLKLGARVAARPVLRPLLALALPAAGFALAGAFAEVSLPLWPFAVLLGAALLSGAPVFAVLGGLALALFWQEGQPLAAVPLSHYQITVNPSLPALPLIMYAIIARVPINAMFLAGLLPAAAMVLFLLAFGGFLGRAANAGAESATTAAAAAPGQSHEGTLPPLQGEGWGGDGMQGQRNRSDSSAFQPHPPPALPLEGGGTLCPDVQAIALTAAPRASLRQTMAAAWRAKWEVLAPLVAIGSLVSGLVTPTESAALTAAYAIFSQSVVHRELGFKELRRSLAECAQTIGGVMLILGMALGLTNFLIDAGIPDAAVAWANNALPGKLAFLVALNLFLLLAGAMMEIFAALVVLVPLLLPVAASYGIEPLHFGVIFLANMEMAFLCPPAGMNIYFASAMFAKPFREVAASVLRPLLAMFLGALVISWLPELSTWLPGLFVK